MQRRSILGAAAAATPAALAVPALAQTQNPELRWRCASSFPKNLDILYGGSENLARRVAQMTDNKFQIRTFAAGEIVPALQVLDALQTGTIKCGQTASLLRRQGSDLRRLHCHSLRDEHAADERLASPWRGQ
jgi:TRAP-type mannitol/chloroaromatic compound transport system substrate-binding protein